MKRNWKVIPHDRKPAQWAGLYVTMNNKGTIVINRVTFERTGKPVGYVLMYDNANNMIGLKPLSANISNVYPVLKSGRHGGRKIAAYRLMMECSLRIKETLEFPEAEIDTDGVLLLDMRSARVSKRALNHPRRRKPEQ